MASGRGRRTQANDRRLNEQYNFTYRVEAAAVYKKWYMFYLLSLFFRATHSDAKKNMARLPHNPNPIRQKESSTPKDPQLLQCLRIKQ